ncbi:WD40 repeat domain-containing serine/threonine protein kinase [Nonomuraea sp. NPDC050556]|uniref:WD40 repeat domain-containing serine/threonine protein kinase n=1 Tax=Nonomuraea sp. NPDC050556 TaxID=3364369 RepID=UPI0037AACEFD
MEYVGEYAIARKLGSGGQGVVYEGYSTSGERVAVKVLHTDYGLRRPFEKEVVAARRVAAFCTARILAAELDNGRPYIVSEFVDGPSLAAAVDRNGPYTGDALRRLAIGTATAMAAIHDAGVAHCDLKPDNVLLGPDGPRVIDFGIARIVDNSLTASRGVVGTPGYMAPELFNGAPPGPAADVFAWGAVMVFAATGRAPFDRMHVAAVINQVLSAEVELDALDEPLRGLVARSLNKDPAGRPTARQLLLGLLGSDVLDEGSRAASQLSGGSTTPPLGERAERAYAKLGPTEQALVSQLLLRMVRPGDTGDALVSVDPAELSWLSATTMDPVLDVLSDGGVIRGDEAGVSMASPALIHAWPRLRELVAEERQGLATYQRLREAARSWERHGRREGDLYNGVALELATAWAATARRHLELSPAERDFLNGSSAALRRRARNRRLLSGILAVLLVGALGLAGLAELNRREAQDARGTIAVQRDEAVAKGLAARAETLRQSDPAAALLLSVAAARVKRVPDAQRALVGSLAQSEVVRHASQAIGVGADGRTVIEAENGTATVTDAVTGANVATVRGVPKDAKAGYLSADRTRLLLMACPDIACGDDEQRLTVWSTATGKKIDSKTLSPDGSPDPIWLAFQGHTVLREHVTCGKSPAVLGTPDASLLMACTNDTSFGLADGSGAPVDTRRIDKGRTVEAATLSADGKLLAVQWTRATKIEWGADVWTVEGRRLGRHLARAFYPAWTPYASGSHWDGTCPAPRLTLGGLLTVNHCGLVMVWNFVQNNPYGLSPPDYEDTYAPEGVMGMTLLARMEQPLDAIPALTADGGLLTVVGGGDLRVAEMAQPDSTLRPEPSDGAIRLAAVSPDGRTLAAMDDSSLRLVDLASGRVSTLKGPWVSPLPSRTLQDQPPPPMAFSPDSTLLAVNGDDAEAVIIDVATASVRTKLTVPHRRGKLTPDQTNTNGDVLSMAFSTDNSTFAMAVDVADDQAEAVGSSFTLWDLRTARMTRRIPEMLFDDLHFTADGKSLVTGHPDDGVCSLDLAKARSSCPEGRSGFRLSGLATKAMGFSPDHRHVLLRISDGTVALWDPATGRLASKIMRGHAGWVSTAAFSHDGKLLATGGGDDHLVRLWDLAAGTQIGLPFPQQGEVLAVGFSPDDRTLYATDVAGGVRSYPLDVDRALKAVCAKAGRDLSAAEQTAYEVPITKICT